jgi:predicted DNA-binding antitoxin AbrB/MazE fold protein
MNELAREVTLEEGMKQSVSIAQVKEVLKITFSILAEMEPEEYDKLIRRYRRN